MGQYLLFTDGSCIGNPGPGGWAYLLKILGKPGFQQQDSGHEKDTTNSRMELRAIVEGLKVIPDGSTVEIYTDSTMAIQVSTSKNPKLKNRDLVDGMRHQLSRVTCYFSHVKAHNGHTENEFVDKLAFGAAQGKIGIGVARR